MRRRKNGPKPHFVEVGLFLFDLSTDNVSIILWTIALWRQWNPSEFNAEFRIEYKQKLIEVGPKQDLFLYRYYMDVALDELIKRANMPNVENHRIRGLGPTNVPFNGIPSSMPTSSTKCINLEKRS